MYSEKQYEEFQSRMHERFPKMFEGKYGGFACGPGWWPMLETLCATIQSHIDQSKGACPQVTIEQIKEKFGTLRFYYQGGDEFVSGAVWFAESMSGTICEECGSPGKPTQGGWIQTLCDFHIAEKEALRVEEMKKNGFEE
jgi:hypothetical protein